MGRKILVAIDDSENAMRAVEFIAKSFIPSQEITLFSVIPDTAAVCNINSPELTPYFLSQKNLLCSMEEKKRELVDEAMEKAKQFLLEAGFKEEHIFKKVVTSSVGIARDIIIEADSGYDSVVLGRRGLSGIQEFFMGSVSQKVLHSVKNASVMLVS